MRTVLDRADELARAGRFGDALELLGPELTPTGDGSTLYFAGRLAMQAGDLDRALDLVVWARSSFEAGGDRFSALRTDLGRINVLDDLARHGDAIATANRLLDELDQLGPQDADPDQSDWLRAAAAENLGASLGLTGRHDAAARSLHRAERLYAAAGSNHDRARVMANLGIEKLETGRPMDAISDLEEAQSLFADAGDADHPPDPFLVHRCSIHLARAHAVGGHYGQALSILDQADAIAAGMTDIDALRARLARNEIQCTLNLWAEVVCESEDIEPELRSRGLRRETALNRWHRGQALTGLGRVAEALDAYRGSISLFDVLELPTCAARVRVDMAGIIDPAEASHELDVAIAAFDIAGERRGVADAALARADLVNEPEIRRTFVDTALAAGGLDFVETAWRLEWHRARTADEESRQREAISHLRQAIGSLEELRADLDTDHQRAPFMVGRRQPLETLVDRLLDSGDVDGALEASLHQRSWTFRHADSETTLAENTVLYQILGDRLLAFVSTADGPIVVELGQRSSAVDELLVRLDAEWRHVGEPRLRVHLPAMRQATDELLHSLYLSLLAPVERHLSDRPVTIIPTGRLAMVPFHALHDGVGYVIDRRETSLALRPTSEERAVGKRSTLVVGVPDRHAPSIADEAEQVAEIAAGRLLLGAEATASEVHEAIGHADIVHLACHSVFEPTNPWLSSVRFADRQVRAAELADWDFSDRTVVLSSCSSGRQGNLGEDELLGLPRALLSAGAAEVVMSLWPVDDTAAVGLNTHLHSKLSTTATSGALRSAQLAAKQIQPHPYLWAAPTLSRGRTTPTPIDTRSTP